MSHLPKGKKISVPLLISRGKSAMWTVEPLNESAAPAEPTAEQIAKADTAKLKEWWRQHPSLRAQIEERVAELTAAASATAPDQPEQGDGEDWPETAAPGGEA